MCRNKKCDWWSDFKMNGCRGTPILVSDIMSCINFQKYESELKKNLEVAKDTVKKAEEIEETEEVINSILSLEL